MSLSQKEARERNRTGFVRVVIQLDHTTEEQFRSRFQKLIIRHEMLRSECSLNKDLNHFTLQVQKEKTEEVAINKYDHKVTGSELSLERTPALVNEGHEYPYHFILHDTLQQLHLEAWFNKLFFDPFSIVSILSYLSVPGAKGALSDQPEIIYTHYAKWLEELQSDDEVIAEIESDGALLGGDAHSTINLRISSKVGADTQSGLESRTFAIQKSSIPAAKLEKAETLLFLAMACTFYPYLEGKRLPISKRVSARKYQQLHQTLGLLDRIIPIGLDLESTTLDGLCNQLDEIAEAQEYLFDRFRNDPNQPEVVFEYIDLTDLQQPITWTDTDDADNWKLQVFKKESVFECKLTCADRAFDEQFMLLLTKRLEAVFLQLIQQTCNQKLPLNTITSYEEKLLGQFSTGARAEVTELFPTRFAAIAHDHPEGEAIVYKGERLTYQELLVKTDQIGQFISSALGKAEPNKTNYVVAVKLTSYLDAVTVFLAGLRFGFGVMPVDMRNPVNRVEFMLTDSGASLYIHDDNEGLSHQNITSFSWPALLEKSNGINNRQAFKTVVSEDLAYLLYTSGSTGQPKGVKISQGNLINYLSWANSYYFQQGKHHFGVVSPLSFDLSITGIFSTLLRGDTVFLFDPAYPDKAINEALSNENINTLKITPAHIALLSSLDLHSTYINKVIVGGEKLTNEHVAKLQTAMGANIDVYNEYGPTECTVGCSVAKIATSKTNITIGKPIDNVTFVILNKERELVPIGVFGELYVTGDSVAMGYTNKALTDSKFVSLSGYQNRFYKTGDAARWLIDGDIDFAGRIDDQIKVNGILIEPKEIETAFTKHFQVGVAAFTVQQGNDQGNSLALAYVQESPLDSEVIKNALSEEIPEFMIPGRFLQVKNIPLTSNGKIDVKLLTEWLQATKKAEPVIRDAFDREILTLIEEVLGTDQLSIEDHFLKIGGHSISAVKIITQIKKRLLIDISLKEFFENLQLKEFIDLLKSQNGTESDTRDIQPVENQTFYPASKSQSRLWVLDQFEENTLNYNVSGSYLLEGHPDLERIRWASIRLVERHEILRTTFSRNDQKVVQKVLGETELDFQVYEISQTTQDWTNEVRLKIKQYIAQKFDLAERPPCKIIITRVNNEKMVLTWVLHHIICDAWSLEVLYRDFMTIYEAYPEPQASLPDLSIQYRDYASWQNEYLRSAAFKSPKEKLIQKYQQAPRIDLPSPKIRPAILTNRGKSLETYFQKEKFTLLKEYAAEANVSVFMLLMTFVNVLLYRYSGQKTLVMGTTVAGRQNGKLEDQVGFYVNTIPLKFDLNEHQEFEEVLQEVRKECIESFSYDEYPFDELVKELNLSRELNRNPLFDILVSYNNTEFQENASIAVEGLQLNHFEVESGISQFDLTFRFNEFGDQLLFILEYSLDLFDARWAKQFNQHLINLIDQVVIDKKKRLNISDINFLSEAEREKVLYKFNDTQAEFPSHETLITLFERVVEKMPDKKALFIDDKVYTFQELNTLSNQLAHHLVYEQGVKVEDVVALMVPKNEWMIVGVLGILKAGAAYLPLDVENPSARVNGILNDAQAKLLLIDKSWDETRQGEYKSYEVLNIKDFARVNSESVNLNIDPSNLAYIIYTSGSTGKPKGVMIEHKSVINRIDWMYRQYQITPEDVILQKTPYVFDVSVWELFIPLCFGTSMVLCPKEKSYDVEQICGLIERHKVTTLHFVPSMLNIFMAEMKPPYKMQLSSLKRMFTSGEALLVESAKKLYEFIDIELHNLYGPTEATVDVTYHHVGKDPIRIPIGAPIHNTSIFVLDQQLNPVPIGVTGDIYLSGEGLARGYIHNPELTAQKFVDNPFTVGSKKMYKTGDSGQWDHNGEVLFKGRTDFQIKLRGYRIELGDIESQMINYGGVRNAVVVLVAPTKDTQLLVGYVDRIESDEVAELKQFLTGVLPEYMVPAFIVTVEQFEFTATGKIDRKALPDYRDLRNADSDIDVEPRTNAEKKLMRTWGDILGLDQVGRQQNYFDLGGNSINATQVLTRINKEFEIDLKLGVIFKFDTIEQLASHVEQQPKKAYKEIKRLPDQDSYRVSYAQRRVWLAQQIETSSPAYNINMVYRVVGAEVNREYLEGSIKSLISRHELFRIKISNIDGELRYRVLDPENMEFELRYMELGDEVDKDKKMQQIAFEEALQPFDLENNIPIRAMLVLLGEKDYLLSINYHHIISDGWSNDLIVNEMIIKYFSLLKGEEIELPEVKVRYSDYVAWHEDYLKSPDALIDKNYWHEKMANAPQQKDFPFSLPRPAIMTSNGKAFAFAASAQETDQLRVLAKQSRATLFHLMTAMTNLLIHKYTAETDIIVGSNSINRSHKDLELSVGMYLDIILIRNTFTSNHTFADLVKTAKTTVVEAQDHQRYPLDEIMDDLGFKRDISKTPLFNYFVLFQNFSDRMINEKLRVGENDFTGKMKNVPIQLPTGKFDLSFIYQEVGETLSLKINFNVNLFREEDILDLAYRYKHLLTQVLANPDLPISEYTLLDPGEQERFTRLNLKPYNDEDLVDRINNQCEQNAEEIAVVYADRSITYQALARHSNYVADTILSHGFGYKPIPVLLNDGLEYVIALLANLKLGGTIVPINANWPEDRIGALLDELAPEVVLCEGHLRGKLEHLGVRVITDFFGQKESFVSKPYGEEDVPYIIYTSGTTGMPKGVQGAYKGLLNRLQWMNDYFGVESARSVLQSTKNIYDSSLWQILWPLMNGGKVVIPLESQKIDVAYLQHEIEAHSVTMVDFVPSLFNELVAEGLTSQTSWLNSIRDIIFGGEAISVDNVLLFRQQFPQIRITNLYGPTEASIGCIYYPLKGDEKGGIPIGQPISNVGVLILNNFQLTAPNIPGEIFLHGACLSHGYFKDLDKTNKNFFTITVEGKEVFVYRTGDLGRYNIDGEIEFLGRADRQVKVNGLRIELGEIESNLLDLEGIREAVVDVKEIQGRAILVAYYTSNAPIEEKYIRGQLKNRLPSNIIPQYFVQLEKIPLTEAGKLDGGGLPLPGIKKPAAPVDRGKLDEITLKLIDIWEEKMSLSGVTPDDDFFELGGNSLQALRILNSMQLDFGIQVQLRDLFEHTNVESLSGIVKEMLEENSQTKTFEADVNAI